jgi:hypothetical protein
MHAKPAPRRMKLIAASTANSKHLAIHIEPAALLSHKATAFMLAHCTALQAKACNKLDLGTVWAGLAHIANLQAQPTRLRFQV